MQATTVGLDLAKNVFHVHGVTQKGGGRVQPVVAPRPDVWIL